MFRSEKILILLIYLIIYYNCNLNFVINIHSTLILLISYIQVNNILINKPKTLKNEQEYIRIAYIISLSTVESVTYITYIYLCTKVVLTLSLLLRGFLSLLRFSYPTSIYFLVLSADMVSFPLRHLLTFDENALLCNLGMIKNIRNEKRDLY